MHLTFRSVNDAFRGLVRLFYEGGSRSTWEDCIPERRSSRYGDTLMIPEPVLITYTHPRDRVLLNSARDANPFFHLYEALWMLSGRNDVDPLAYYNKRMMEFSDDGKTLNGAYGYRWRQAKTYLPVGLEDACVPGVFDQLTLLVNHLKAVPTSRRAVLQMWSVEDDLLKVSSSKDLCCNLSVMFSLRENRTGVDGHRVTYLDMTVTNRSNDLIWGLVGANYVHFSILQEYMAAHLGAEVGKYHHFTNNLHVYTAPGRWEPEKWLEEYTPSEDLLSVTCADAMYHGASYTHTPLVKDPVAFDKELSLFVEAHRSLDSARDTKLWCSWTEPFLRDVAQPMLAAFHWYKKGDQDGTIEDCINNIQADDWRLAAALWMKKRGHSVSLLKARKR